MDISISDSSNTWKITSDSTGTFVYNKGNMKKIDRRPDVTSLAVMTENKFKRLCAKSFASGKWSDD